MRKLILIIISVIGVLFINSNDQRAFAIVHVSPHVSVHTTPHVSSRTTIKSPSRSGSSIKSGSTFKGSIKPSTGSKVKSNSNFKGSPKSNVKIPSTVKPHSSKSLKIGETNYRPPYSSSFSSPRFWMWYYLFNHSDYKDKDGKIHKTDKFNWAKVLGIILIIIVVISLLIGVTLAFF